MLYGNNYGLSASPFGEQLPPPAPPPLIPRGQLEGLQPHTLTSLGSFGKSDDVSAGIQKAIAKGDLRQINVTATKPPASVVVMSFSDFKKEFLGAWYTKWWVWALAVGGVATVGGGYWYVKRGR